MGHAWEERDEAVVAASVDEVWAAIATGPGIDSWFMGRNKVDPGPAGSVTTDLGGFVSTGTVTAWDPPNYFAYRSDGPGERFIAFEYLIEGRDQSSTALRLVTSGFLPDDDWEAEFEAMTAGGQMYFQTLVAYLDHFAGRFATPVNVTGPPVADWPAAWAALRTTLGLGGQPAVSDPVHLTVPGVPRLDGLVDFVNSQALGIRTANGLFRFIQGYFGSFVLGHHIFSETEEKTSQAWKTWLSTLTQGETMGSINAGLFITLDGVVEAPQTWQANYFNDEMGAAVGELMTGNDAMLLGRQTYDEFAAFWPNADQADPTTTQMNATPKYVVSTTLEKADWENSTVVSGDIKAELLKLKQDSRLGVTGSATLVRWLLQEKLIDELHLFVHPVAVGAGKRLFEPGEMIQLRLIDSTTFSTGVLHLVYGSAS